MLGEILKPALESEHSATASEPVETRQTDPAPKPSSPRRILGERERGLMDCMLLICLLATVAAKCVIPAASMDEDLWWHVGAGNWILSHGAVPLHDVFSTYTMGAPWIDYTWLFDCLAAKIYDAWGLHGTLVFTTLMTVTFIAAVVFLLSQHGRMMRSIALGALAFAASATIVTPRPWLFTCVFFVIELYLLLEARSRARAAWLMPLPPLFALWANLHIQFVYGLGIIGLFAIEGLLAGLWKWPAPAARLHARWFCALLAASVLATLVNPYGWRLYVVVAQYATEATPLTVVQEMQAMQFRSVTDWAALFLACSALFAVAGSRRKCALMISLLIVSFWFGFHTGRDCWFLAVVSALAIVYAAPSAEPGMGKIRLVQWAIAIPVSLLLAFSVLGSAAVSPVVLQQAAEKRFPVKAAAYIESHSLPGPLYNPYGWGGYLIWRLPAMPVSIDGRANLHGDARLSRAVATWLGSSDWASDLELMKARTVLVSRDSALASILRSDSRFHLAYEDDVASVFQPVGAAGEGNANRN